MTIIVGICDGRSVWMGGDSFAGNGGYALQTKHPKLFRRTIPGTKAPILFGFAGDFRIGYLLRTMPLPESSGSTGAYVAETLVNAMRARFRDAGILEAQNEMETNEAQLLISCDGRLFSMWEDFMALETGHDYMAVGSAMEVALGSLHSTGGIDPETRLDMALDAAETHNAFVKRPFHKLCIGGG